MIVDSHCHLLHSKSEKMIPEIISDGRNLRDFLEGETSGEPTPPRATRRLAQLFSENPDIKLCHDNSCLFILSPISVVNNILLFLTILTVAFIP